MGLELGGKPDTKPCVFPCKVAAAGDERYLVCAAGAGWVRPRLGVVRAVIAAMCFVYSCTLQLHGALESLLAHCNGCMNVTWGLISGISWSTKPCAFPCKVVAAGDERYLVCAAGAGWVRPRLGVVRDVVPASMCFWYSCSTKQYWEVLCASFVARSSTGIYFVQAL